MNKYFSLLLISSAVTLYGQNPPKNSYDQKIEKAKKDYEGLSAEEKAVCDLACRNFAVQHARMLRRTSKSDLIPAEISPDEKLDNIDTALAQAKDNVPLSKDELRTIYGISYYKIAGLWKAKADSLGKECTWKELDEDAEDN
jgi:hypothetical protein